LIYMLYIFESYTRYTLLFLTLDFSRDAKLELG
jgi:hypothetical protein